MDGLPMEEKTGLPYASVNPGRMHACGHDGILAVALTLCGILSEEKEEFPVNVRFLFEPAEEIGEGAKRMIKAGALDGPADAFLMFHFAVDMPFGMAVHEGQASAMIAGIGIEVKGKSSHWSEAHKGIDSIYAGARVIQEVHDLNESYQGHAPCLVGIGTAHGGEYGNIIADSMTLTGKYKGLQRRRFSGTVLSAGGTSEKVQKNETGTKITLSLLKEPVLSFANDSEFTELAAGIGQEVFGERFILEGEDELFLAGDNAYRYFQRTRGVFLIFLAAVPGKEYPLHHPKMELDENIFTVQSGNGLSDDEKKWEKSAEPATDHRE